jgi:DNA-binding MarR family transcriptional regulator
MAGRILGRLLVCDSDHQSSSELGAYLGASKASVSTATRQLVQLGLLEQVAVPNARGSFFRVVPDAWERVIEIQVAEFAVGTALAERGLTLLAGQNEGRQRRIREFVEVHRFMGAEMPMLLEHWRSRRNKWEKTR